LLYKVVIEKKSKVTM